MLFRNPLTHMPVWPCVPVGVALQQRPWLSVLEYCIHGDLQEILRTCFLRKKKRGRWRFVEQLHIAQQVCVAVRMYRVCVPLRARVSVFICSMYKELCACAYVSVCAYT